MRTTIRRRCATTNTDAAVTALHVAKRQLQQTDRAIDAALALLRNPTPPDPPSDAIPVHAGDDLLSMIAAAPEGSVFDIDPDYTADVGDCEIPKACTLRAALLSTEGRISPDETLPTLTNAAIVFAAPGITMIGIRVRGKGTTALTLADDATLDRCVVTGPENDGSQQRGVYANAANLTIVRCAIVGIHDDVDSQAVLCTRFTNHLHIDDCWLEASGENFMSGGDDGESEDETPQYILIENSHLSKPLEWMSRPDCSCKNLLELKNAKAVVVRHCTLDYSWADGQVGYAVVLTVRNQYGRAPWSTIEDVLIEDNAMTHCGGGFQLLGRDNNYPSQVMRRVTIRRNAITDLSSGWQEGSAMAAAQAFFISGGPDAVTIEDNDTAHEPGWNKAALAFDQLQFPVTNLVIRGCRMYEGDYGITGCAPGSIGVEQIAGHAPGYIWDEVTIVRGTSGRYINYPAGTVIEE